MDLFPDPQTCPFEIDGLAMIAYVLVIVAAWSVGFGGLVWMLWRSSAPVATLAVAYVLGFAGWSLFVASAGWHIFTISCW